MHIPSQTKAPTKAPKLQTVGQEHFPSLTSPELFIPALRRRGAASGVETVVRHLMNDARSLSRADNIQAFKRA
jgi:hypothetical protein